MKVGQRVRIVRDSYGHPEPLVGRTGVVRQVSGNESQGVTIYHLTVDVRLTPPLANGQEYLWFMRNELEAAK